MVLVPEIEDSPTPIKLLSTLVKIKNVEVDTYINVEEIGVSTIKY